jgi:nitroreductase
MRTSTSRAGLLARASVLTAGAAASLALIAAAQGVGGGWQALFAANQGTLSDPNHIVVGQELQLR